MISIKYLVDFGCQPPPKITDKLPPSELAKIGWPMKSINTYTYIYICVCVLVFYLDLPKYAKPFLKGVNSPSLRALGFNWHPLEGAGI